jgi:mRNA-degrading endonuclease RelE of RelBE toxin-antitoxin system
MKSKYELAFAKEFLKRMKKVDRQTQIRILKELKIPENQPFAGKQLVGRLRDVLSLRVGDSRVIYQVSDKKIVVRTVGHCEKVYEK